MNQIKVHISPKTFFIVTIGLITFLSLYYIRNVVILFLIAFILQAGLRPIVDGAQHKYKIPRFITTVALIIFTLFVLGLFIYLTADIFLVQLNNLIQNAPELLQRALEGINSLVPGDQVIVDQDTISSVITSVEDQVQNFDVRSVLQLLGGSVEQLNTIGNAGFRILGGTANFIFTAIIVVFAACYMIIRERRIYEGLIPYAPLNQQHKVRTILNKVQLAVGNWFIGQVILMVIVGVSAFIIIMIPFVLRVPNYDLAQFALIIALIAGLTEALPNIGPTISLVLILLIALGVGVSTGILIYLFIAFILLQQLEGILIVPTVMKRAIDIDPVLSIFGIIIGFNVAGVIGAIVSLPVIASLQVTINELRFGSNSPVDENTSEKTEEKAKKVSSEDVKKTFEKLKAKRKRK